MIEFKPGDTANGHVLGTDNVWHPVAIALPKNPTRAYWGRYGQRFSRTYLVLAFVAPLSFLSTTEAKAEGVNVLLLNLLVQATVLAAFVAFFVNLLVAIPATTTASTTAYGQSWLASRTYHRNYGKWLVALGVGALVFGIGATLISNSTPEGAYLNAMHRAAPADAVTADAQYLQSGHDVCKVYVSKGWDGVEASLTDIYQTRGAAIRDVWTVVAKNATKHLCPAH